MNIGLATQRSFCYNMWMTLCWLEPQEACSRATGDLLQTLGTLGYCASAKKERIARHEVIYLGYKIRQGQRWLTQAMKETILQIPEPKTPRQMREFWGTVVYCRL